MLVRSRGPVELVEESGRCAFALGPERSIHTILGGGRSSRVAQRHSMLVWRTIGDSFGQAITSCWPMLGQYEHISINVIDQCKSRIVVSHQATAVAEHGGNREAAQYVERTNAAHPERASS